MIKVTMGPEDQLLPLKKAMWAWNDGGSIRVGPWPDRTGWSDGYLNTDGACYSAVQDMSYLQGQDYLIKRFNYLVVVCDVDAELIHTVFYKGILDYFDYFAEGGGTHAV